MIIKKAKSCKTVAEESPPVEHVTDEIRYNPSYFSELTELLNTMAVLITKHTGKHGLIRLVLTSNAGAALGLDPLSRGGADIMTACGLVNIINGGRL